MDIRMAVSQTSDFKCNIDAEKCIPELYASLCYITSFRQKRFRKGVTNENNYWSEGIRSLKYKSGKFLSQ